MTQDVESRASCLSFVLILSTSVTAMLKSKKCGGKGDYLFLHHFASNKKLKVSLMPLNSSRCFWKLISMTPQISTKAIVDKFVLGKTCVNCEILEADVKGVPPDQSGYDEKSQSLLDIVVAGNDEVATMYSYYSCGPMC